MKAHWNDLMKKRMGALLLKLVIVFFSSLPLSVPLPFAIFHGLGDSCSGAGINSIIHNLNKESGEEGFCVEIGNGRWDSLFMPLQKQTDIACEKVKKMEQLRDGFNVVGFSQGNLIARGVIEFCDGAPLVKNFISICGPHAGIAAPVCKSSGYMCRIFNRIIKEGIYSDFVQNNIAVSGYCKTPTLNNERSGERHATYKKNFSNLTNPVLIMSKDDSVLKPRETSWFGYYLDGSFTAVLNPHQCDFFSKLSASTISLRLSRAIDKSSDSSLCVDDASNIHPSNITFDSHVHITSGVDAPSNLYDVGIASDAYDVIDDVIDAINTFDDGSDIDKDFDFENSSQVKDLFP